ncbi:MAG: polysaccharide biosynthesis protein [Gammaproteobacteria bacterium]|nr:polysaccharide biosynthesis protein [Gammaproteobacteria bacterium]
MKKSRLNRTFIIAHDLFMISAAWLLAFFLRYNFELPPDEVIERMLQALPGIMLVQAVCYWYFDIYRGVWRFTSARDVMLIGKAVLAAVIVFTMTLFVLTRLEGIPRSVPLLYSLLMFGLLVGPRFLVRINADDSSRPQDGIEPVLVVGAGSAGEMIIRDLLRDPKRRFRPVGILDDDTSKRGKEIHGVRVLGNIEKIPRIVAEKSIQRVIVAIPSATTAEMRRIVEVCEGCGVQMRTLPKIQDIISGDVSISTLKEVAIDDLLGRDAIELDWEAIRGQLTERTILVTGAGGSIGSELCRQISRLKPARLVIVDHGEYNLYRIDMELRKLFPDVDIRSVLLDVTNTSGVDWLFESERPSVVFHAAAYKHVPLLEDQVAIAAWNNILGTRIVADAAVRHGTNAFVLVSTDKAVNPTNVMGTTKRVAEMYCQSQNTVSGTHFITVRFGNVLGSAGSVIPLFREQIAAGGPVTVTHEDITRYFMTIPEAAQLIMQAAAMGQGGEIFVLDMGEPIRIAYLAEQMILLSGKTPGEDIEIRYTGLRPGEKLYEELFYEAESHERTTHTKIFRANTGIEAKQRVESGVREITEGIESRNNSALVEILRKLVPENRIGGNAG